MNLYNAKETFLTQKKTDNFSVATLRLYRMSVKSFISFISHYQNPEEVILITEDIKRFIQFIQRKKSKKTGKKLSNSTKSLIFNTVKAFCDYLLDEHEEESLAFNTEPLSAVRFTQQLFKAKILTESEIQTVFSVIHVGTCAGYRDRTIFELLYSCGIRKAELCNLDIYDINFEDKTIFIRQGKGKKDRYVPMGKVLERFLKEYLSAVRPHLLCGNIKQTALFVKDNGEPFSLRNMAAYMARYSETSGVEFSCHSWRHTFATHMLKHGAPVIFIKEILGHEDISTTQKYTQVYPVDLKKIIDEHHPRSRKELTEEVIVFPVRRRIYNVDEAALRMQQPELTEKMKIEAIRLELGRQMRLFREKEGISQIKFGELINIPHRTISRLEQGLRCEFDSFAKAWKKIN
jgi:integrase/recombinase XerD